MIIKQCKVQYPITERHNTVQKLKSQKELSMLSDIFYKYSIPNLQYSGRLALNKILQGKTSKMDFPETNMIQHGVVARFMEVIPLATNKFCSSLANLWKWGKDCSEKVGLCL